MVVGPFGTSSARNCLVAGKLGISMYASKSIDFVILSCSHSQWIFNTWLESIKILVELEAVAKND